MPRYALDEGETVRRKHLYLPCVLHERLDDMSPAEQAAAYKAAYWADLITQTEWPVVLGHEGTKRYTRSRLVKKAAGWLVAVGRIARLNPDLFAAIVDRAMAMYREQVEEEHPLEHVLGLREWHREKSLAAGGRVEMVTTLRVVDDAD